MKKNLLAATLCLCTLVAQGMAAQTADEIVAKSRDLAQAKSMTCKATITITSKAGAVTERAISQAYLTDKGLTKSVIVFLKPESVRDTRFLIVENADHTSERWIYLPESRKVRRISSDEGSGSFMGSDFSYDDLAAAGRDATKDSHVLVGDGAVAGKSCWIIESTPKAGSSSQYAKTVSYIEKATYVLLKAEMYDRKGKLLKTLEVARYKKVGAYWTTLEMTMKNVQTGSSTRLSLDEASLGYDKELSPKIFTTTFLETGKI